MNNITDEYLKPKRKGEASRSRLLEVALQLFAENGYNETKISDIVKAAGVTQPSFYLYFANKEAIFAELEQQMYQKLGSLMLEIGQSQAEGGNFQNNIEANLLAVYQLLNQNPELTRLALVHASQAPAVFEAMEQMMHMQLLQIRHLLNPTLELELTASAMIGMVKHFIQTQLVPQKRSPAELAKFTAQFQLFGIIGMEKQDP